MRTPNDDDRQRREETVEIVPGQRWTIDGEVAVVREYRPTTRHVVLQDEAAPYELWWVGAHKLRADYTLTDSPTGGRDERPRT